MEKAQLIRELIEGIIKRIDDPIKLNIIFQFIKTFDSRKG